MMDRARYLELVERLPREVPWGFGVETSIRLRDPEGPAPYVEVLLTADRGTGAERFCGFRLSTEELARARVDIFGSSLQRACRALEAA